MPHIMSIVKKLNRGQLVELKFTVNCTSRYNYKHELESEVIKIDERAAIRFKFVNEGYESLQISLSLKQQEEDTIEEIPLIINVTCKNPKYSEKWYCPKKWTEMKLMGHIKSVKTCDEFRLYTFDVTISVSKPEKPVLFANLYDDTELSDFVLTAVDGSVAVHRVVLAVYSDMFKAMLLGKWKEAEEGKVELGGASLQTLHQLKEYMYLGTLPEGGVQELLILAQCYLIEDLKVKCIRRLTETVTPDNLYSLLQCACENNIPELTFEILHCTPSDIVQSAYELKNRKLDPKPELDNK